MPYTNPVEQKQAQHRSYIRNRERILLERKTTKKEGIKEYKKAYRQENRDKRNAYMRAYLHTHPEYRKQENAKRREWRLSHLEHLRAYKLANKDRENMLRRIRRAKGKKN